MDLRRGAAAWLAASVCAVAPSLGWGQECEAGIPYNFSCAGPSSAKGFLAEMTDPSIYFLTERPRCGTDADGDPTLVEVQFFVSQVNSIDQKASSIVLNGYLRTFWKDPRLAFKNVAEGGCFDSISLMDDVSDRIWTPDLFIENLISSGKGLAAQLTEVSSDGSVWVSKQVLLRLKLEMDLGKLPYDEHVASVVVASTSLDATKMRVVPRGGTPGEFVTGLGVVAGNLEDGVWSFPNSELEDPSEGFSEPGRVWSEDGRDFVSLEFPFKRKPKFFIDQVCVPSVLFLLVSYIQFFVPAEVAPARAALAVIPVLIMRTMSNSVYEMLPQGSQQMWLGDFLQTATFLCCSAALQFGLVQLFLQREHRRTAKQSGVLAARPILQVLISKCEMAGITLPILLNQCEKDECTEDEMSSRAATSGDVPVAVDDGHHRGKQRFYRASDEATKLGCKEADIAFLQYALQIFQSFDFDESEVLNIPEVRKSLVYFNIYVYDSKLASIVCMFLRDIGKTTPVNELEVTLGFSDFLTFIMLISEYSLVEVVKIRHPFKRAVAQWQALGPAEAADVVSRIGFPIILILFVVVFYIIRPLY